MQCERCEKIIESKNIREQVKMEEEQEEETEIEEE